MKLTAAFLADAAQTENGKLFVHGGGWDTIGATQFPTTHPTMALVWILKVDYDEALEDLPIQVELLTEDNQPVGPRVEGVINAGHAPRKKRGTPTFIPQTFTLNLLKFDAPGGYHFRIASGDEELGSVPFQIIPATPMGRGLGTSL